MRAPYSHGLLTKGLAGRRAAVSANLSVPHGNQLLTIHNWNQTLGTNWHNIRFARLMHCSESLERTWAKSYGLSRNQSWNGRVSFEKPAKCMSGSSRRPNTPLSGKTQSSELLLKRDHSSSNRYRAFD